MYVYINMIYTYVYVYKHICTPPRTAPSSANMAQIRHILALAFRLNSSKPLKLSPLGVQSDLPGTGPPASFAAPHRGAPSPANIAHIRQILVSGFRFKSFQPFKSAPTRAESDLRGTGPRASFAAPPRAAPSTVNVAHIRKSRPDSGLGFGVTVL